MPEVSNQAADRGNIVHKALEVLARKKLALQEGKPSFTDPDTGREFDTEAVTPEDAFEFGWWFYTAHRLTPHTWTKADRRDCRKWMYVALEHNDGQFSPLKRDVIAPEQYFDLEIDQPWATYDHEMPDGSRLQGRLAIKGTVDLVTRAGPETIEYVDWKSGRCWDWATDTPKDYRSLRKDPQLRMYHYALCRLYPDVPYVLMTIFFLKGPGPFSLPFSRDDLPETEEMIRRRFELVRDEQRPALKKSYKCKSFCHFGKNLQPGTAKTICEYHRGELQQLGMERAFKKHADPKSFRSYGSGGGCKRED